MCAKAKEITLLHAGERSRQRTPFNERKKEEERERWTFEQCSDDVFVA